MSTKPRVDILGWTGSIPYPFAYATTGLNTVWTATSLFTLERKWLTRN